MKQFMKKRKWQTMLLVLLAAVLICCAGCKSDTPENTTTESTDPVTEATMIGNMGLEDSIFDDPTENNGETTAPADTAGQTESTDPSVTQPAGTQSTEPENTQTTTPPATQAPENDPEQPSGSTGDESMDYETYIALTPAEQRAYMESFESLDAYFEWYNAAKAAYEKEHPPVEIPGNGVIEIG